MTIKPQPQISSAQRPKVIVIALLAMTLIWLDSHTDWLQPLRQFSGYLILPAQKASTTPAALANWFGESAASHQELLQQNKKLIARNLILETKAQRLASLEAENIELRELLSASEQIDDRVLVSSLTAVDPDPYSQQVLIDKGAEDGVFIGQPVLDAFGLLGQVIDVLPRSARVLMIADSSHAIPVQVNRNGVRAIATGTGKLDFLELIYVPNTADIEVGDLLVSSGLGGRYPKGYPVAIVNEVENIPGKPFARVTATPSAQLDRSRHLLLVFQQGSGQVPPENLWRKD